MKPHQEMLLVLFTVVVCLLTVQSAKLPSDFKKCSRKSPDFEKCLLDAIQDSVPKLSVGNKELGLPMFDPLDIPYMKIGAGHQTVHVDQIFKNVKLYGYSKAKFYGVKLDLEKKTMDINVTMPLIEKKADYKLDGSLLLLPVQGQGKSQVDLVNLAGRQHFSLDIVEKNGKKYLKVVDAKLAMEPDLMRFHFENLFNGEKLLGDNINKVLNENWKDVWADIGDGYAEVFSNVNQMLANKLFAKVPLSELFDE